MITPAPKATSAAMARGRPWRCSAFRRAEYLAPRVTGLDWTIPGSSTQLALYGYGQGFVVGALSLAGFAAGGFAGSRLAPLLLEEGARSPYAPLFALGGALLGGTLLAVGLERVGQTVRRF